MQEHFNTHTQNHTGLTVCKVTWILKVRSWDKLAEKNRSALEDGRDIKDWDFHIC